MNSNVHIENILKNAGVEYRFIPLPEDLAMDLPSHVRFHKIEMKDAVPTLIYRTEKGLIAVQRRADTKIDERKLRELVGMKELRFASEEDLHALGTEVGIVPPTGLDIPFFTDKKVLELPLAYCGGGIKTFAVTLKPKDLVKINNSTLGDFTMVEKSKEMLKEGRHRLLSGITPSGDGSLHIGNYLGAVKQFIELAKTNETYLMVADLHGLTTIQDKKQLSHNIETLVLNELALLRGFMTEKEFSKIVFFRQSDVPMHTELQSILNNVTPLGLIKRAHAYKDKLQNQLEEDDVNMGLFNYPILMAADILLYKPDLVPVGKDQKQHIEITRDIAERFNRTYGEGKRGREEVRERRKGIFKLPEAYIPEEVAVILGTDGKRKMSKSLGNLISIFESEEIIRKQVMGTYTDPTRIHATDPGHIEGNMVFAYLDFFGNPSTSLGTRNAKIDELKKAYTEGKVSDVEVKNYLFESLIKTFAPARKVYQELKDNPERVKKILHNGTEKARSIAKETMKEVRDSIGLTNAYSFMTH